MALRVLLADESSTIKKVIQLALAEFGVEVKAVPVGLDVLAVTKSFKPDIVFADVLLTKRSGYDVCSDLKNDSETSSTPVVLMWSGFMEIDEAKIRECGADRQLEKPFDADTLRGLVKDLVPKTQSNPVSEFLSFPKMPEFEEAAAQPAAAAPADQNPEIEEIDSIYAIPDEAEDGTRTSFDNTDEEFASVPLTATPKSPDEADEGGWSHQDLSKFKIQLPEVESEDFASKFAIPESDEFEHAHVEIEGDFEEVSFEEHGDDLTLAKKVEKTVKDQMMETLQKKAAPESSSNAEPNRESKMDMGSNMMEKVIREEARQVIESVCWKILPDIAERIVREEINKILRDTEKSI